MNSRHNAAWTNLSGWAGILKWIVVTFSLGGSTNNWLLQVAIKAYKS